MKLRRILVVLFTLCLAVGVLAISASADTVASGTCGTNGDNLTWTLDDEGTLTISGEGRMRDYYNSTRNIAPWASYREEITAVIIKNGAANIGDYAFSDCRHLTSLNISDGVTSIGEKAFSNCTRLTDLVLPEGLTSIGDGESKYDVFAGCSGLKTVTIPTSVTYIAPQSFLNCPSLETVYYFGGSDAMWKKIDIQEGNGAIESAARAYKYTALSASVPRKVVYAKQNKSARVTVEAKGTGKLSYQWFISADGKTFSKSSITGSTYSVIMNETSKNRFVYCVVSDLWGNTVKVNTVQLRRAATIIEQPKSVTAVEGNMAKVSVGAVGDKLTYTWYAATADSDTFTASSTYTGSSYSIEMTASRSGRKVYCVVTDAYGNTDTSDIVTLKIHEPPVITTQPKTAYAKQGAMAKVSVSAKGVGLTYQWYIKNAGAAKYSKSSVTSANYSCIMNSTSKDRLVYCVITDALGFSVKTETVCLRMAATVTAQPANAAAAVGSVAKTTVKAMGDGLTYAWYIKNPGASAFSKSSVTAATYSCKMTKAINGRQVYCVVKDKYGRTDTSNTVIFGLSVKITAQSKTTYTKQGAAAKATVTAVGDGLKYQWYIKNAGQTSYSKSSVTGAVYACKMNSTSKDRLVYCVVTDKYGKTARTEAVRLRMAATITSQPKDVIAANGAVATTTVKAVGDGLTYTWYIKNPGKTAFSKSSVTTASYSCKMSAAIDGREVYCVVTDKYGKTVKSATAVLSME